jgi:hypothetical protein
VRDVSGPRCPAGMLKAPRAGSATGAGGGWGSTASTCGGSWARLVDADRRITSVTYRGSRATPGVMKKARSVRPTLDPPRQMHKDNVRSSRAFPILVCLSASMSWGLPLDDRACLSRNAAVIAAEQWEETAGDLRQMGPHLSSNAILSTTPAPLTTGGPAMGPHGDGPMSDVPFPLNAVESDDPHSAAQFRQPSPQKSWRDSRRDFALPFEPGPRGVPW